MSEHKQQVKYRREEAVDAFRKLVDEGATHPDSLPDNELAAKANSLLDKWTKKQRSLVESKGTLEAELEFNLDKSTIYIDAGFAAPDHLDEVANDWLAQDLQSAEDKGLVGIAKKIQDKINTINSKLLDKF